MSWVWVRAMLSINVLLVYARASSNRFPPTVQTHAFRLKQEPIQIQHRKKNFVQCLCVAQLRFTQGIYFKQKRRPGRIIIVVKIIFDQLVDFYRTSLASPEKANVRQRHSLIYFFIPCSTNRRGDS